MVANMLSLFLPVSLSGDHLTFCSSLSAVNLCNFNSRPSTSFLCSSNSTHSILPYGSYFLVLRLIETSFTQATPSRPNMATGTFHSTNFCLTQGQSTLKFPLIGMVCWNGSVWVLSGQYVLNHWTFSNQTWYGGASSWAGDGSVMKKKRGLLSVIVRAHVISIWLLLYLLT